jgi:hypothetical protein
MTFWRPVPVCDAVWAMSDAPPVLPGQPLCERRVARFERPEYGMTNCLAREALTGKEGR